MKWNRGLDQPDSEHAVSIPAQGVQEPQKNSAGPHPSQNQIEQAQMFQRQAQMALPFNMFPYMQQQALAGFLQGSNQYMMGAPMVAPYVAMPFSPMGIPNMMQSQQQPQHQTSQHTSQKIGQTQERARSDPSSAFLKFQPNAGAHANVSNGFALNGSGAPYSNGGATSSSPTGTPKDSRSAGTNFDSSFVAPAYASSTQTSPNVKENEESTGSEGNRTKSNSSTSNEYEDAKYHQSVLSSIGSQHLKQYRADQAILKVYMILNIMNSSGAKVNDVNFWKQKLESFFMPSASIRYTVKHSNDFRCFDMSVPMIPILWAKLGSSQLVKVEIVAPHLKAQTLNSGNVLFHSPGITCSYYYPDGSYMTHYIRMKGVFDTSLRIEWLELCAFKFVPGIEWPSLEKVFSQKEVCSNILQKLESKPIDGYEPNETGAMEELRSHFSVFRQFSNSTTYEELLRLLQISDVMTALSDLVAYQKKSKLSSPIEALNAYVNDARQKEGESNSNTDLNFPPRTRAENSNSMPMSVNGTPISNEARNNKQTFTTNEEPALIRAQNISPACSPHGTMRHTSSEKSIPTKRKRSNKSSSRSSKDSASSTPLDSSDRGIPGTKKIKF